MPFLGVQPTDTFASVAKQTLTGDILGTTVFTLDHGVSSANDIALYINNVRQEPVTAYTASGSTLTLTESINAADDAYLIYIARTFQSLSIRGITDNTEDAIMTIDGSLTTGGDAVLNVGQNQTSGYYVQDKTFGFEMSNGGVGGNTAQIKNAGNVILRHNQIQDNLKLRTGDTDRVTILSGGNVGIGESAPTARLHVQETQTSGTDLQVARFENNTSNLYIRCKDGADTNSDWEFFLGGSEGLIFSPYATEKMRLDGDGLKFNGDTAAANALDDYEEGTFTATLRGSTEPATLVSDSSNYYTKIGNVVKVRISLENVDTTGYAGDVSFTGLPFTSANNTRTIGTLIGYASIAISGGSSTTGVVAMIFPNSLTVATREGVSASAWLVPQHSAAGTGKYFFVDITYMTA